MKTILIIAPHPDDEVLGCAGAIQHHKKSGNKVCVHIVANRVKNHQADDNYLSKTKDAISRVQDLFEIDDMHFTELHDEQLDRLLIDVIVPIQEYIGMIKPDIAFIPNDTDTDQDHRAVANACKVACCWIPEVYAYEVFGPSRHFPPNCYLGLTEEMLNNKIAAMKCYEGEMRAYPHPRSEEGIRIMAQARGMEANVPIAEAYRVIKQVIIR